MKSMFVLSTGQRVRVSRRRGVVISFNRKFGGGAKNKKNEKKTILESKGGKGGKEKRRENKTLTGGGKEDVYPSVSFCYCGRKGGGSHQ